MYKKTQFRLRGHRTKAHKNSMSVPNKYVGPRGQGSIIFGALFLDLQSEKTATTDR